MGQLSNEVTALAHIDKDLKSMAILVKNLTPYYYLKTLYEGCFAVKTAMSV